VDGWPYYLLASTNLALPSGQWTRIATNRFVGGTFNLTNSIDTTSPQNFYRLELQ